MTAQGSRVYRSAATSDSSIEGSPPQETRLDRVYFYIRYLVLITPDGPLQEITYRDLETPRELRDGDTVVLDELLVRVRAVISADDNRYDGQIICRPDADQRP